MFVTSSCEVCDRRTACFENEQQSVNSRAMGASENVKDECDMMSSHTSYTVERSVSGEIVKLAIVMKGRVRHM